MRFDKKYFFALIPVLGIVIFSIIFNLFITPESLVSLLGVNNAYFLIFALALLGGITTFSGVPYHLFVITMAVAGLNPVLLGIVAASGVMLGDSTSYYLGSRGSNIISVRFEKMFQNLRKLIMGYPKLFPAFCFLYGSLIPLSNDFITITSGLINYPFWKVIVPLGLGNLVFNTTLALLATNAYGMLQGVFF